MSLRNILLRVMNITIYGEFISDTLYCFSTFYLHRLHLLLSLNVAMALSTSKLLKRSNSICVSNFRCFSTQIQSAFLQKKFEPHIYNGASAKPSETMRNHMIDTKFWDQVELVDNDIFINTPAKAGTTWTQEIVAQLLYDGDYTSKMGAKTIFELSPWPAVTVGPPEMKVGTMKQQLEDPNVPRRIIKTHEPVETLPFNPKSKYLFVSRDYRDIVWSMYNHYKMMNPIAYDAFDAPKDYDFKPMYRPNFDDGSFTEYDLWQMLLNEPCENDGTPDGWYVTCR